jgi:DNA-binding protein HU-beta
MERSAKTAKSPAAAKTNRPVTLKHLAATLAEEHHLTKRAGEALLGELVCLITKHLKKGERVRIAGLGILRSENGPLAWGAILALEKQSRLRQARKSRSGRPKI